MDNAASSPAQGQLSPVLLFYDGYERRAEPTFAGQVRSRFHGAARALKRTLRREQVLTGFGTWFAMLRHSLRRAGIDVRVNDFAAARRDPRALIGVAGYPSVLDKVASLPNPRILGPGLYASPLENPQLFDDERNLLILLGCKWHEDVFRPWYGDRVGRWFGGFDLSRYEDAATHEKAYDVLIYDKIYFDRDRWYDLTIGAFRTMLEDRGLRYTTIRYGAYHHSDYLKLLKRSRCMAFFVNSETQGMAYQECMASSVPVFAWDEGVWANPAADDLGQGAIPCTSVPYFSQECGMTFAAADMRPRWDEFRSRLDRYDPRGYVRENLNLEASAAAYLAALSRGRSLLAARGGGPPA